MSLPVRDVLDAVVSHAQRLGVFDTVQGHEPKSSPGYGLTCAVWAQAVETMPGASGLSASSARMVFTLRLYSPMTAEPEDEIDPNMLEALDLLFEAYHGDFLLELEQVWSIDLLGAHGDRLRSQAGYLEVSNGIHRIIDITLPLVINDVWEQSS